MIYNGKIYTRVSFHTLLNNTHLQGTLTSSEIEELEEKLDALQSEE